MDLILVFVIVAKSFMKAPPHSLERNGARERHGSGRIVCDSEVIQLGIVRISLGKSASLQRLVGHCWRVTGVLCLHTLHVCLEAD
jgi:hypothetical protein